MPKDQKELSGMEAVRIDEIDQAANAYVAIRDKRMALTSKEITAKAALVEVVLLHEKELAKDSDGNRICRFDDDQVVTLTKAKQNVKVRHLAEEGEGEAAE